MATITDTPSSAPRRVVPLRSAAEYAGVHPQTIRRRIADGSLPAYRFGPRNLQVNLDDIDELYVRVPAVGFGVDRG